MKNEHNKNHETDELMKLAKTVSHVGSRPHLSRAQKRQMLMSIVPQRPLFIRLLPALASAILACLLVGYPLVQISQPGDALYDFKRGIEDVRSSIQPSYDEVLIKKRDDEIKKLEKEGNDKKKLDIVKEEKKKIEDRLKNYQESDAHETERSSSSPKSQTSALNNAESEHEEESHTGSNGSGSTQGGNGTTTNATTNTARDACKANLDTRKKAGENISSDQYKQCDHL